MHADRVNEWLQWVLTTSVPLFMFDRDDMPVRFASGCLLDYGGKRFLLTVQHAVQRTTQDWAAMVRYDRVKGIEVYRPNSFNYMAEMTVGSSSIRHIDFCYTEVPRDLVSYHQNIAASGETFDERIRHVFYSKLDEEPNPDRVYAFSGHVFPNIVKDVGFYAEPRVYPGLRYYGRDGEYCIFRLPVDHPGHNSFRGCSGAPIVDMNRNVVALVCCGNESGHTIRGVSVPRYKIAFDILCGRRRLRFGEERG
jgi:hypothetical protein